MRRTSFLIGSLLLGMASLLWMVPGVLARGGGGGGGHGGGAHGGGAHGGHGGHHGHGGGFYGSYGGYGYPYYGYGSGYAGYDYPEDYVTDDGQPVHVTVQVPADAQVWFNGVKTHLTGTTRKFVSPPMAPGNYRYEIRASWAGQNQTREVTVHPGDDIKVQFKGKTAPATAP
jgi:uncharacterized protein (TIGR03000 family)